MAVTSVSWPGSVCLGPHTLGPGHPPLIVAELSGNHHGSLERALALVHAAAKAGAHAVKLQTYTADSLTLDHDGPGFTVEDPTSPWAGRKLYDLYREAATPREWHEPIFQRCRELGLLAFSTPFDPDAVDFLQTLHVPAYKIASFELVDLPLIAHVGRTGKPLILSTGMATLAEIDDAVETFARAGGRELILLRCTSAYPADASAADLVTIPDLQARFHCPVGLSDHNPGMGVAIAAVALGACLVEKHFTLRRADGGPDASFSLEPEELQCLVSECNRARRAIGSVRYGPREGEAQSHKHRRSLYAVRDIQAGECFTADNVRSIRPAFGLSPGHLARVLRSRAARTIPRGTPLTEDLIMTGDDR